MALSFMTLGCWTQPRDQAAISLPLSTIAVVAIWLPPASTIAVVRTKQKMFSRLSVLGSLLLRKVSLRKKSPLPSSSTRGGHLNNSCDHLFNVLKRFYRAQNIETFQDLIRILNKNDDNVVATEVTLEDFHGTGPQCSRSCSTALTSLQCWSTTTYLTHRILKTCRCRLAMVMQRNGQISSFQKQRRTSFVPNNWQLSPSF